MKRAAFLAGLLLVGLATPAMADGITGRWGCLYGIGQELTLTVLGDTYALTTSDGQKGQGGFVFANPDETVFTLNGYLADKLGVVGGKLTQTPLLGNPELDFIARDGTAFQCTQTK
jgi:hypothetical protein